MYLKKLKIGNIELENNIISAPMAGITDRAYRIITKEYGVGLVVTEMVSSKALYYNDKKTKKLMDTKNEKRPISIQIFGSDPEAMRVATKYVNEYADIIDINMGCPAPKIVKNGDGSALLQNLELAEEVIKAVVEVATVPVTVKFRTGWNDKSIVAVEFAKMAEKAGAKMLTIHGRTREQYYIGDVNLDLIKAVKEAVSIPVIGNGDIKSPEDAKKMFEYTGVDGIMVGRATIGNPWIIRDIIKYLQNEKEFIKEDIENSEKLEVILKHIDLLVEEKGELVAVKEMRKHIAYYVKNLANSTKIREVVNKIEERKELEKVLKDFLK